MSDVHGRITIKDLARDLGLSAATVSLALNDEPGVNEETRQRVKSYALRVRYRPNASARAISTGRTRLVAVVLDRLTVSFFEEIVQGIENVAVQRNYDVLVNTVGDSTLAEAEMIERLIGRHIEGLIAATLRLSPAALSRLDEVDIPVLVLRPDLEEGRPVVTVDNRAGGRLAARHLIELGHRHILFVGDEQNLYCRLRAEGANEVLATLGMRMEPCPVHDPLDMEDAYGSFCECLCRGLEFTAAFCADDIIAVGVCKALHEASIAVPRDVSVIGYDDLWWTRLLTPPLTTIHQPQVSQGETAMQTLVEIMESSREGHGNGIAHASHGHHKGSGTESPPVQSRILQPRLVVRGSTAPPLHRA